jgi:hypothetical protein
LAVDAAAGGAEIGMKKATMGNDYSAVDDLEQLGVTVAGDLVGAGVSHLTAGAQRKVLTEAENDVTKAKHAVDKATADEVRKFGARETVYQPNRLTPSEHELEEAEKATKEAEEIKESGELVANVGKNTVSTVGTDMVNGESDDKTGTDLLKSTLGLFLPGKLGESVAGKIAGEGASRVERIGAAAAGTTVEAAGTVLTSTEAPDEIGTATVLDMVGDKWKERRIDRHNEANKDSPGKQKLYVSGSESYKPAEPKSKEEVEEAAKEREEEEIAEQLERDRAERERKGGRS